MATVPTYNFTWQQGEDGVIALVYKVGSPEAVPVDLSSDYEVRMDVSNSDDVVLFTFNSEDIPTSPRDNPGTSDNEGTLGADGEILILVPRSASLPGGALVNDIGETLTYDLFLRNSLLNHQKKILKGTIKIEESVTLWN